MSESKGSMKRYLVFVWPAYEAFGGWNDLWGDYDTREQALNALSEAREHHGKCFHGWCVVDMKGNRSKRIIEEGAT